MDLARDGKRLGKPCQWRGAWQAECSKGRAGQDGMAEIVRLRASGSTREGRGLPELGSRVGRILQSRELPLRFAGVASRRNAVFVRFRSLPDRPSAVPARELAASFPVVQSLVPCAESRPCRAGTAGNSRSRGAVATARRARRSTTGIVLPAAGARTLEPGRFRVSRTRRTDPYTEIEGGSPPAAGPEPDCSAVPGGLGSRRISELEHSVHGLPLDSSRPGRCAQR